MRSLGSVMGVLCISCLLFSGCATNKETTANIKLSKETIAKKVASSYGEKNPQIVSAVSTDTDNDHSPMYLMHLKGHFHKGTLSATDLYFSALKDGSYDWALRAVDSQNHGVWLDNPPRK